MIGDLDLEFIMDLVTMLGVLETDSSNLTLSNNDQIQLRVQSSTAAVTPHTVNVVVGSGSAEWRVTTGQIPVNTPFPAPDFGVYNDAPLNFQYVYSDIVQINGLTTTATISVPTNVEAAVSNFNTTFTNAQGDAVFR